MYVLCTNAHPHLYTFFLCFIFTLGHSSNKTGWAYFGSRPRPGHRLEKFGSVPIFWAKDPERSE